MKKSLLASIFIIISTICYAEDNNKNSKAIASLFQDWSFTVGGGVLYQPEYQGAREMEVIFLPVFSPVYKNFFYLTPMGGGVFFPIYKNKIVGKAGVGYDLFNISGERVLRGLDDKEDGLILDTEIMFNFNENYMASMVTRKVFWGSDSLHIEGRIGAKYNLTDKLTISFRTHATFGDRKYMRFKFGITKQQSIVSGFPEYEPCAGIKSIGAEISVRYHFTQHMFLILSHTENMLINQALSSPTTFRQRQPVSLLLVNYKFN